MTLSKIQIDKQSLEDYIKKYAQEKEWKFEPSDNDDSTWYLRNEDGRKQVSIVLTFANKENLSVWESLVEHMLEVTASVYNPNKGDKKGDLKQLPPGHPFHNRSPITNAFKVNEFIFKESLDKAICECNEYYDFIYSVPK